jgi:hypothetical protein
LSPFRAGFVYGTVAVAVAIVGNLYFLFLDPGETQEWILAAVGTFLLPLRLTVYLFLGILAALRTRPKRLDPEVPYRSLLLRDAALAGTVVGVMAGITVLLMTALQATFLADDMRYFAREAAPRVASYVNEERQILSNPPPPATAEEVEGTFQPPELRDLGRSTGNLVIGTILLGAGGALVGALRGSFGSDRETERPSEEKSQDEQRGAQR